MAIRLKKVWLALRFVLVALKRPPLEIVRDLLELLRLIEAWLVRRRGSEGAESGSEK